jgi:hypothetical protein
MEERWVIPLAVATMAGFLLGLLSAVLQLTGGSTFAVGVVGVVAAGLAATASVLGSREGMEVAGLRALFASLLFLGIFLAMLAFLRDGRPFVALLWAVFAGVMAGLLVRVRAARKPRERREERGDGHGAQPA